MNRAVHTQKLSLAKSFSLVLLCVLSTAFAVASYPSVDNAGEGAHAYSTYTLGIVQRAKPVAPDDELLGTGDHTKIGLAPSLLLSLTPNASLLTQSLPPVAPVKTPLFTLPITRAPPLV